MKDKAKKLVNKFWTKIASKLGESTSRKHAKQCALMCIVEKIKFIKSLPISDMMKHDLVEEQLLIQQEINKL